MLSVRSRLTQNGPFFFFVSGTCFKPVTTQGWRATSSRTSRIRSALPCKWGNVWNHTSAVWASDAAAKLLSERAYRLFCPQPGNGNSWFEGPHLLPLLRKVLALPDGPETDLLQYLDRLANSKMQSFPFAGYHRNLILICQHFITESWSLWTCCVTWSSETKWRRTRRVWPRQPEAPCRHATLPLVFWFLQTGIWTELYKIEDAFLKPLRVGVNMSRAHYEMELHKTEESEKSSAKGRTTAPEESPLSVTVGEEKLPHVTSESHVEVSRRRASGRARLPRLIRTAWFQALRSALHVFDMMESVLVRIEELTQAKESLWRATGAHGAERVPLLRISASFGRSNADLEEDFPAFISFCLFVSDSKPVDKWGKEASAFDIQQMTCLSSLLYKKN